MAKLIWCFLCLLIVNISVGTLQAPKGLKVSFLEPSGVYVEWDELPFEEKRSIDGYTTKVWIVKEETTRNYKLLNGEQYPGLEKNNIAKEPFNQRPSTNASVITKQSRFNYDTIRDLSFDKLYEIAVFAYKGDNIGPMSDPRRIKLVKNNNFVLLAERRLDTCAASIVTNRTNGDEPFVHITVI